MPKKPRDFSVAYFPFRHLPSQVALAITDGDFQVCTTLSIHEARVLHQQLGDAIQEHDASEAREDVEAEVTA